jgi:hypothetical protein
MGVYVKTERQEVEELRQGVAELGPVIDSIVKHHDRKQRVDVKFSNTDIKYLQRKTGLSHRFVARMLRIFGEEVVLESLRRLATRRYQHTDGQQEAAFIYICRGVESVGKEG